jgi:hypothetical protein
MFYYANHFSTAFMMKITGKKSRGHWVAQFEMFALQPLFPNQGH